MPKRERDDVFCDSSEEEVFPNYVPLSERRKATKAPPRKRANPTPARRSGAGIGIGVGVGGGSPAGTASGAQVESPSSVSASIKKERSEARAIAAKNAPKIIAAIDFGTTYSGCAFAWSHSLDQTHQIMDPDNSNNDNPKGPSAIRFLEDGSIKWGGAAKGHPDAIEWCKLLLVDEEDLPEDVRNSDHIHKARNRLRQLKKTPEAVIGAFLKALWSRCLEKMKSRVGETTVKNSRFHVVMTLPAIWPDYARQRMRVAAELAGITEHRPNVADTILTFVSEPEAAALATLKGVDGRCDIVDNDCFVICDCGGGTVDIIAYKAQSTEPMAVREIVKGAGRLCGAVFVDDQFMLLLKQKFDEMSPDAWDVVTAEEIRTIVDDDWEKIRNQFNGDEEDDITIRLPASLYSRNLVDHANPFIRLTPLEIKEIFRPTLEKITALVNGQIRGVVEKEGKKPKYVILVGGFGRNKYMHAYLKPRVDGVEVLQAEGREPWEAICKGGVIHGMTKEKVPSRFTVEVASRISRASYGVVCQELFDEDTHLAEDKFFDEQQQVFKAKLQMKWLIKQGDEVATNKKSRHNFNLLFEVGGVLPNPNLRTDIWICHTWPPPTRRDESVTKHSTMQWSTQVHWDQLPRFFNKHDKAFYELEYQAEMVCSGGATDLGVVHKGNRVANRNVKVDYVDKLAVI